MKGSPLKHSDAMDTVEIQCSGGEVVTVERKIALLSETLKNLIEDAGTASELPLPNITHETLQYILEWCRHYLSPPANARKGHGLTPWEKTFVVKVGQEALWELNAAANYLDIPPLLDLTNRKMGADIAQICLQNTEKNPEEFLAGYFGIEPIRMTEEERRRLEQDCPWLLIAEEPLS